jgi:hypothetical protein
VFSEILLLVLISLISSRSGSDFNAEAQGRRRRKGGAFVAERIGQKKWGIVLVREWKPRNETGDGLCKAGAQSSERGYVLTLSRICRLARTGRNIADHQG